MNHDPKYVPVIEATDVVELAEIRSLLEGEGIRLFQAPADTTGLMGPTDQLEILVHIDDEEEAVRLLEKNGFFFDEDDEAQAPVPVSEEEEHRRKKLRAQDLVLAILLFILLAWGMAKIDFL